MTIKSILFTAFLFVFGLNIIFAQQWMRSLPVAQNLAIAQNKMVLMVWEDMTQYPYPVIIEDGKGRKLLVRDMFTDEYISPIIWDYFVPVIVNENAYADMYEDIKGKRKQSYIDKFNDDSIKIMDVNGRILNVTFSYEMYENINKLIDKYALRTEFLKDELKAYHEDPTVYTAYFVASKYLDFAVPINRRIRPEIINMSELYMEDARYLLETTDIDGKITAMQRLELLHVKKALVEKKPRSAIRQLKRIEKDGVLESNQQMFTYLSYTANMSLCRTEEAEALKSELTSLNLMSAKMIINLNKY